jgi:hypothetical protein
MRFFRYFETGSAFVFEAKKLFKKRVPHLSSGLQDQLSRSVAAAEQLLLLRQL